MALFLLQSFSQPSTRVPEAGARYHVESWRERGQGTEFGNPVPGDAAPGGGCGPLLVAVALRTMAVAPSPWTVDASGGDG